MPNKYKTGESTVELIIGLIDKPVTKNSSFDFLKCEWIG